MRVAVSADSVVRMLDECEVPKTQTKFPFASLWIRVRRTFLSVVSPRTMGSGVSVHNDQGVFVNKVTWLTVVRGACDMATQNQVPRDSAV